MDESTIYVYLMYIGTICDCFLNQEVYLILGYSIDTKNILIINLSSSLEKLTESINVYIDSNHSVTCVIYIKFFLKKKKEEEKDKSLFIPTMLIRQLQSTLIFLFLFNPTIG
jgi:hypothetical protein